MHFTSFLQDGNLTVALTGEIDHHCAKEYIRAIAAKKEKELSQTFANLERIWDEYDVYEKRDGVNG